MIRVQYFARYREALGIDGEQLNWDAGLATLGALRQLLVERGGAWERTLGEQNLMCARNQEPCMRRTSASARWSASSATCATSTTVARSAGCSSNIIRA